MRVKSGKKRASAWVVATVCSLGSTIAYSDATLRNIEGKGSLSGILWAQARIDTESTVVYGEGARPKESVSKILHRYYSVAADGSTKELVDLFASKDGSQNYIKERLKKNPDKYSDYHKIGRVVMGPTLWWGDYRWARLRITVGKKTGRWQQMVLCNGSCRLSTVDSRANYNVSAVGVILNEYDGGDTSGGENGFDETVIRWEYDTPRGNGNTVRVGLSVEGPSNDVDVLSGEVEKIGNSQIRRAVRGFRRSVGADVDDEDDSARYGEGRYSLYDEGFRGTNPVLHMEFDGWKKRWSRAESVKLRGAVVGQGFSVLLVRVRGQEWQQSNIQLLPVGEKKGMVVAARQAMPVRLREIVDSGQFYTALKVWMNEG